MPECPNCKHKNDFWDVETMTRTHLNTAKFIEIEGCHHKEEDCNGYDRIKQTKLYGCPKCHIVFWVDDI